MSAMSGVTSAWARIDRWLVANAPSVLRNLAGPASDAQIAACENAVGAELPGEVLASYRVHNGQPKEEAGLLYGQVLLPLKEVVRQWRVWKELVESGTFKDVESDPDEGIRRDLYHLAWVPLTHDGGGNHFCVDLDPEVEGTRGQVISFWHDDPQRVVVARGLAVAYRFRGRAGGGEARVLGGIRRDRRSGRGVSASLPGSTRVVPRNPIRQSEIGNRQFPGVP
jgi:cell wall assembly regulator SMI1